MEKVGNLLREKILIVDDTRFHRAVAADILARAGYATVEVDNGGRALEMVNVESPDLILLDSAMPDLDGLEMCRRLKGDPFTNHIPILIFTNHSSIPEKVDSMRLGADGYLAKPFTPEELVTQVQAVLRRSFHYDPLTKLPAAPYLHRQIDGRLAQNQPTAVVYADLDHLRAYNQAYGHEAGDQVLIRFAKLLVELLPAPNAFAGHLGSDDFIAVLGPGGAETFSQTLVERCRALQSDLYSAADRQRGFLRLNNRRGEPVEWKLLTLSAALVTNEHRVLTNYVQASELLAEVMRLVKAQGGDQWARDRRAS